MKDLLDSIGKLERIRVRVKTSAGVSSITGYEEGVLKVSLRSAPEKGKANQELVKLLTRKLGKKVTISSGLTSKNKVVKIS